MKKPGPAKQLELPIPREILSLGYLQAMLGRIYPKGMHSLHEVVEHVIEEIGETLDALAANDQRQAKEEFADIFAWIMQVANTTDISLVQQKPS